MNKNTYFLSSHGIDIGMIYSLPKDVRVIMHCTSGEVVSACNLYEAALWHASLDNHSNDEYLKVLDNYQYCVYSGNLPEEQMNRIPDLILSQETQNFVTGLYESGVNYNVVITAPRCSEGVKGNIKEFGEITKLDKNYLKKNFKIIMDKGGKIDSLPQGDQDFVNYFLRPVNQKNTSIEKLKFLILPEQPKFKSFYSLVSIMGRKNSIESCSMGKKIPEIQDEYRKKPMNVALKNGGQIIVNPDEKKIDLPSWLKNENIIKKIRENVETNEKSYLSNNIYLSDLIRFLCNINKGKFITIVLSACRSHPNPTGISLSSEYKEYYNFLGRPERNGKKINDYLNNYANLDYKKQSLSLSGGNILKDYQKYLKYKKKYLSIKFDKN